MISAREYIARRVCFLRGKIQMPNNVPKGFSHQFLCRACVQRDDVRAVDGGFQVVCGGVERPALRRSECSTFRACPHRLFPDSTGRVKSDLDRPGLADFQLRKLHIYARSLPATISLEERNRLVSQFEAELHQGT